MVNNSISSGTPKWALDPFRPILDAYEEVFSLMHVSQSGIAMLQAMPKVVSALELVKVPTDENADPTGQLERAESDAKIAKSETENDFPLLNSWVTIHTWTLLETFVPTYLSKWMSRRPSSRKIEELSKIKINFREYESTPTSERNLFVIERFIEQSGARASHGASRFESILKPFGLNGSVSSDTRKSLGELHGVRNALVHRNGIVDHRLKQSCPWIKEPLGTRIKIRSAQSHQYVTASMDYILQLIIRVQEFYGVDMSAHK